MPVDYSDYPPDWKLRSKFIRFHRAKNHCEKCGVKNGEPNGRGWKVVLTVAHVFDKSKKNGSFLNLAALCQKCHLRLDAVDRKKEPRFHAMPLFGDKLSSRKLKVDCQGVVYDIGWASYYTDEAKRRVRAKRNAGLFFLRVKPLSAFKDPNHPS